MPLALLPSAFRAAARIPRCLPPFIRTFSAPNTTRRLRNDEIPHEIVRLVDPTTNLLHPPTPLSTLLQTAIPDSKTHYLELMASSTPYPVVKLVDRKAERAKYKENLKKMRAGERKQSCKEIQVTWGAAAGDLAHKVEKVRDELRKGRRVEMVFAPKKGQVVPTRKGMEMKIESVLEQVKDLGREYMPRDDGMNIVVIRLKPL